jgi:acyl-CoA hydrolase
MTVKTPSSSRTETSQVVTPNDANFLGKVFGGSILSMVDLCAYATASRFAGNIAVTASIDRVDFHEPIEVGEVVTCVGEVTFVGRTSMEVTITVFAENVLAGVRRHTNTARVTMVALKDGQPVEVPRLAFESREDKIRFLEGRVRRELRQKQVQEREALQARIRELSEEELDRLIEAKEILGLTR